MYHFYSVAYRLPIIGGLGEIFCLYPHFIPPRAASSVAVYATAAARGDGGTRRTTTTCSVPRMTAALSLPNGASPPGYAGLRGGRRRGGGIPRRRRRRILPLRKRRGLGRGGAARDRRIPSRPIPRDPPGGRSGGGRSSVTAGGRGGGLVPSSPRGPLSPRATGGHGLRLDPLRGYLCQLPPSRSL